jgi:hypothetical protein
MLRAEGFELGFVGPLRLCCSAARPSGRFVFAWKIAGRATANYLRRFAATVCVALAVSTGAASWVVFFGPLLNSRDALGRTIINHRRLNILGPTTPGCCIPQESLWFHRGFPKRSRSMDSKPTKRTGLPRYRLADRLLIHYPLSQPQHKPLRWLYRQCVHALKSDLVTRGSGGQRFALCCHF